MTTSPTCGTSSGCRVLVTGGTKGIGLATATRFAEAGHPILIGYRRDERAATAALRNLPGTGHRAVRADLSTDASPLVAALAAAQEPVHALVLNAAATAFRPLVDLRPHHLNRTIATTVGATIELVQALAQRSRCPTSSLVTVSGGDSVTGIPGHALLGAAKAALETMTRYLAAELAPLGIRANCVLPGPVETDSARRWAGEAWTDFRAEVDARTPAGRLARPTDIASVIYALCGADLTWVNGQVLVADGGLFFSDNVFRG